jgi:methionine-rich copper-binding protein CopC
MLNIALPITLVTPLDTRMPKTSYATPTQRASGTPSKMIDLFTPAMQSLRHAARGLAVAFDSALEGAFSTLTVVDAQGKPVTQTKAELDAARKTLTVALPPLKAGDYQANWVAVANDGHRTKGSFKFTVK